MYDSILVIYTEALVDLMTAYGTLPFLRDRVKCPNISLFLPD